LVLNDQGEQVEGFSRCTWAGALGRRPGSGASPCLKVTSEELPDYVERCPQALPAERKDGERFATWATRAN